VSIVKGVFHASSVNGGDQGGQASSFSCVIDSGSLCSCSLYVTL
jgi:hypothetical protein